MILWIFIVNFLHHITAHIKFEKPFGVFNVQNNQNITTCEEFEKGAYFNPQDVVDAQWLIFYFWADTTELYPVIFSLPAKKRLKKFKAVVDSIEPNLGIEWHKAALMMEPRPGVQILMLNAGTTGAFRALIKIEDRTGTVRPIPVPLIKIRDVRMKQVERLVAMMCCEELSAYLLVRKYEAPETDDDCETKAKLIKFNGLKPGRCHLKLRRRDDEL